MELKQNIYFMGIGGTGMASVAGLCKNAGATVTGSDKELYPPMSTMLEEMQIDTFLPYSPDHLDKVNPDLVVVGNNISRGHPELEHVIKNEIPYTSFPSLLEQTFLKEKKSIVVSGTHGKTTTSSIVAYLLAQLNENPSFLIGGIPRNFTHSFQLAPGDLFIIEGDEYDTCFFDKESKFLHYNPEYVLLNNLEFDHADIFTDLAAVEKTFKKLLALVFKPQKIIANIDDPGVSKILDELGLKYQVTKISCSGRNSEACIKLTSTSFESNSSTWRFTYTSSDWGDLQIRSSIGGPHNAANIAMALGCIACLAREKDLSNPLGPKQLSKTIAGFASVKRRFDHLGSFNGIDVFEDFAHHPTAVETVIAGFRVSHPNSRLIVAFEPKNSSSRRNIFSKRYASALKSADISLIGHCSDDQRIAKEARMDTSELAASIGDGAAAFDDNDDLLKWLQKNGKAGDSVVFMSCGSFSGIPQAYCQGLQGDSK